MNNRYAALDAWIDAHFEQQVKFLQELVRVPTDTPPGHNARTNGIKTQAAEWFGANDKQLFAVLGAE